MSDSMVPLESNPEVLNKFLSKIGVPQDFELCDVYGLEPELLAMLKSPVVAFILLFPCTENYEKHRTDEDMQLKENPPKVPEKLFYMKQYLQNACGTVALFHAVLNNLDRINLSDGALKSFYEKAKNLSPEERGKLLEQDKDIIDIHQNMARDGQTNAPEPGSNVLFHYAALAIVDGELFELDGRKNHPISHGKSSPETFLSDAAAVCKKFMARDEKEMRFSFMAITGKD